MSDSLLRTLLPASVATSETRDRLGPPTLLPAEWDITGRFCDRRLREFAAVRGCARRALQEIGAPSVAILPGMGGAPQWPEDVVGSLTHCAGFVGAAVAWSRQVPYIGIDAERHAALPPEVIPMVCTPAELLDVESLGRSRPQLHWDTLIFSAKEAVYKAWYPLIGSWLDFHDVRTWVRPMAADFGTFEALVTAGGDEPTALAVRRRRRLERRDPLSAAGGWLNGSWTIAGGLIVTAIGGPAALNRVSVPTLRREVAMS